MRIFYTDTFVLPLPPGHRFPMEKYALLRAAVEALQRSEAQMEEAPRAMRAQLERAHDPAYVERVFNGTLSPAEMRAIGFPWSCEMVERSCRSAGATIAAARSALVDGCGINLAGGTHHAGWQHGAGYCVFNDAAVTARTLQCDGLVERVLIVDCDVHQGDGTAEIFQNDASVFTLSLHGARNYPFRKACSDLDVELPDGTSDERYLIELENALDEPDRRGFVADLVIYLAGADPFLGDRLGRLSLSLAGLAERDRVVFRFCRDRRLPVAICMAGGYAEPITDTVAVHCETVRLALDYLGQS